MHSVQFHPFIGKEYHSQIPKILILGESHYRGEGDQNGKEFTRYVIQRFAQRCIGERRKFFTIIARALDSELTNETAPAVWDGVCFYNYVQVFVGNGPRCRPTDQMFTDSRQAFKEVLEFLKPDVVVVLGRKLRSHLEFEHLYFNFGRLPISFCYWTHPSTPKYFKMAEAVQAFNEAKERAGFSNQKPLPGGS